MPLTPEERNELASLDAQIAVIDEEKKAAKSINAFHSEATRDKAPVKPRPFSIYRAGVGALRDAAQGIADTFDEVEGWIDRKTGFDQLPTLVMGGKADNGFIGIARPADVAGRKAVDLPKLEGEENAGTAETMVRNIGSYLVPFTGGMRAFRALGALGTVGRVAQGMAAGAAADFVQYDPRSGNVANILKDFGWDNKVLSAFATAEDDTQLEARFKAAAAGLPAGLVADGLTSALGQVVKSYRAWRGTAEEAAAVVDNLKAGPVTLEPLPSNRAPALRPVGQGADDGIETVTASAIYDPVNADTLLKERDPQDFDDVLDFLKSKASAADMDPETLDRFARNLLEGDPENALAKLGIDPAKLDFSAYADPARLGRLQKGMSDLFESIAKGLGRTGERVTEKVLVRGAESLASTPDILRSLYGATSGLAEQLMGARMFVGAHAHQLLAHAEAALKELEAGGNGTAWAQFLESYHRHAYFLGSLRGAGTEVARALRSLQFLAKAPKQAQRVLNDALDGEVKDAQTTFERIGKVQEGASAYADRLVTDAEKMEALRKLIDLRGDVSELTRHVREGNATGFRRANAALKETMGSLFSIGTATMNIGAGVTFLGLNTLGRLLSAAARTPLALLSPKQAAEARRAWVEAWAYTDGIVTGFSEAYANTIRVLEREGYSELSLVLDGMGATEAAKRSSSRSAKATAALSSNFERADVVNNKAFSFSPKEMQTLRQMADDLSGPRFFEAGLKGLVTIFGTAINATGAAYRSGTSLFINLPDEFVGTLATRAGASAEAVRIAAREAAEYGLEGKELSSYLKARTRQLFGEGPSGWAKDGFEGGNRHSMFRAGETEARSVLFQDDLEWGLSRGVNRVVTAGGGLASVIVPFVKTPMRIIERTAVDYTPLGLFGDRIRRAILQGGSARDEALARLSLGMTAMITAYNLAEDRFMVGQDGGYSSSARDQGRPSYSLRIGDDVWEFGRLDPIGTLLGMGADLRAAMDAVDNDPEAEGTAQEIFKAMLYATAANILSKSWLTSLRQLTDLAGATSDEDANLRWEKFKQGFGARVIPAAGVQKAIEQAGDGTLREAAGFTDGLLKATIGADRLPPKRDMIGREMTAEGITRLTGMRGGVMPDAQTDPLGAELEALSFKEPQTARRQKGVKLNATQFSRFLQIRGQEARDPNTGLTMSEALNELVRLPEYQAATKAARIVEVRKVMQGYSSLAAEQLTNEDPTYAAARLKVEVFEKAELEGWNGNERTEYLRAAATRLGIPITE